MLAESEISFKSKDTSSCSDDESNDENLSFKTLTASHSSNFSNSNVDAREKAERILQATQKDLNLLLDLNFDRLTKRATLNKLVKEVLDPTLATEDPYYIDIIFLGVSPCLSKLVSDPIEKCREIACLYLKKMLSKIVDVRPYLVTLIPSLLHRLASDKMIEPSEEVRLSLVQLLHLLIQNLGDHCKLIASDAWSILEYTLLDPFPAIKKESCAIAILLNTVAPVKSRLTTEKTIKVLVKSLGHRHASVRVAVIQAISSCIFVDASSLKVTWPNLKKLLLDDQNLVRHQVYTLARDWQLHLIDRYSYAMYTLYLLFHGLHEPLEELKLYCEASIPLISEVYEREWESRMKDQLNYNPSSYSHLGFRELVRENSLALTDLIVTDLNDWTVEVRHAAAKILFELVPYLGEHISGYLGKLFPAMLRVLDDPFSSLILETAKSVGEVISPDLLLHLLLPTLKHPSTLKLLTYALEKARYTESHVNMLLDALIQQFESDSSQTDLIIPLYLSILKRSNLFSMDLLKRSLFFSLGIQLDLPEVLSEMEQSPLGLFEEAKPCLRSFNFNELASSRHHPSFLLFKKMLSNCPPIFYDHEVLEPLLCIQDVHMLTELFTIFVTRSSVWSIDFCSCFWPFLIQHLKWKPGKTWFYLREKVGYVSLHCMKKMNRLPVDMSLDALIDALMSAMDDELCTTRERYLLMTRHVFISASLTVEQLKKCYYELLKRLDDASDPIRILACQLIQLLFTQQNESLRELDSVHMEEIIKKITLQIDDLNPSMQNAATETLDSIFEMYPTAVKTHVESIKHYFRNQAMLQKYL